MKNNTHRAWLAFAPLILASVTEFFAGCQSQTKTTVPTTAAAATPPIVAHAAVAVPMPIAIAPVPPPVHIKAGLSVPLTEADGVVWIAEQGFADGDTIERDDDMEIANTKSPALYRTEHFGMTAFSYPVPNGTYIVKLHFAETFDGITGAGQRVFSFNIEGTEFKDFDVFVKAGGPHRAYVETVPVQVADGKLDISFTPKLENPEINGIEILPAP